MFDEGSFIPQAKIVDGKSYSIVSDYLGTPILSFDENGKKVWERELDIYGKPRKGDNSFIPFGWQGQYWDEEVQMYNNRFRMYDPYMGMYISQDPIGLLGGLPNFYAYVHDSNRWVDPLGLIGENIDWGAYLEKISGTKPPTGMESPHAHHIVFKNGRGAKQKAIVNQSKAILEKYDIDWLKGKENLVWAPNTKGIHTKETAQKVLDALKDADKKGTREAVVEALDDLGKKFADKSIIDCN